MARTVLDFGWMQKAIEAIEMGITNRIDSPDGKTKIYKCGSVIRIDIKEE